MSKEEFMQRYLKDKKHREMKHKIDLEIATDNSCKRNHRRSHYGRKGLGQP